MPHISIKMLKGRSELQKKKIAEALAKALEDSLPVSRDYISLTVEDYTAEEWQQVYEEEVQSKQSSLYVRPNYRPEDLL